MPGREPDGVVAGVGDVFIRREPAADLEKRAARSPLPEVIDERSGDRRRIGDRDAGTIPLVIGKAAHERQLVGQSPSPMCAGRE